MPKVAGTCSQGSQTESFLRVHYSAQIAGIAGTYHCLRSHKLLSRVLVERLKPWKPRYKPCEARQELQTTMTSPATGTGRGGAAPRARRVRVYRVQLTNLLFLLLLLLLLPRPFPRQFYTLASCLIHIVPSACQALSASTPGRTWCKISRRSTSAERRVCRDEMSSEEKPAERVAASMERVYMAVKKDRSRASPADRHATISAGRQNHD